MMKRICICITLSLSTIITSNLAMAGYAGTNDGRSDRTERFLFKAIGAAVVGSGALAYKEHKAREKAVASELDSTSEDDKAECPAEAQYGPYYRYELKEFLVVQLLESGWLYGKRPYGSDYPVVQAYAKRQPIIKDHDLSRFPKKWVVKFCTPIRPEDNTGVYAQWYYPRTPGVILHDEDTAKIPVIAIP